MTKEQLLEFEEYAFGIKHNRDYYSRAKIIELLVDKVNKLNEPSVSVSLPFNEMIEEKVCEYGDSIKNRIYCNEKLHLSNVIGGSVPKPPEPTMCRVLREGITHFCDNCGSTSSKIGFLGLFGERLCDNKKCPNSKSKKNCY